MSRSLRIQMVTPALARSLHGNRVTALRWARLLRELGHRVQVVNHWQPGQGEILVALHARRSASSIARCARECPARPRIVVLTGTDLYRDLPGSRQAQESLELATRLVVLQPDGLRYLRPGERRKTSVIIQSAERPARPSAPLKRVMEVAVIAHLRSVKDPFRVAMASRNLPGTSRIRVIQVGKAMTEGMRRRAEAEMRRNPRYQWVGEVSRGEALRRLRRSRLVVVSSRLEGAPNVASEALAAGVPMLSSRISGMQGLLGHDYPGYFQVGDTAALTRLLRRAEEDQAFYQQLVTSCQGLRHLVEPAREKQLWEQLLAQIT